MCESTPMQGKTSCKPNNRDINEKVDDTNILLRKLKTTMKEFEYDDIITTPPSVPVEEEEKEIRCNTLT
nr:hypothetical protein [Tanacetum cinerariifolium]